MDSLGNNVKSQAEPVQIVKYRGYEIPVYLDEPGQQFWCLFDGKEVSFGSFNVRYEEDLKYLIDQKLDTLKRFGKPYFGASLQMFDNEGFMDARLVYRGRIIKVWLLDGRPSEEALAQMEAEAANALERLSRDPETREVSSFGRG